MKPAMAWYWTWVPSLLTLQAPRITNQPSSLLNTALAVKLKTSATLDGGHIFSISKAQYLAPVSKSNFNLPSTKDSSLATVFILPRAKNPQVTVNWMRSKVEEYKTTDDVFLEAFLATVVFQGATEDDVGFADEARNYLVGLGNQHVVFTSSPELLPGPYLLIDGEARDVWKLVDDEFGTCMATLKPQSTESDAFESFHLSSLDNQFPRFALQSRLKTRAVSHSSLAGLRVIIKDNIHLKGVKTSVGNRAFFNTYPPQSESAACVQKLLGEGMVVVGKTKLNSFGNWEEPLEYIDYQAPWNPRGDGYQSTGGSSSGSAAAVAGYDWLDIAIGTDTWGSVTRPALWCGCYALRPSTGAVSMKGVEPCSPVWDTPGLLSRDLQLGRDFAASWLAPDILQKDPKSFSSIIWLKDFWTIIDPKQTETARNFMKSIESSLGVDSGEISLEETWTKSPPAEADGQSLSEFVSSAMAGQCYDAYHSYEDFRTKYWEFFGHAPYTSPSNQQTWEKGKSFTKETRDQAFERMFVYRRWYEKTILVGKNSNALAIMPQESMVPRYRDQPPAFNRPPQNGVNALAIAAVLRSPLLAIPIAEVSYHSSITDQEEKLPFVVALMGTPGTDLPLIDAALKVLRDAGLPTVVKTGKVMFG